MTEPGVSRIAVLRANALGDLMFSLPALDALRAAYPDAEITLLAAPWHARLLAGRPGPVDRVLVVPPAPGIRSPEPGESTVESTVDWPPPGERFDLAIQLHGGGRNANPFTLALGAPLTVGLRAEDAPSLDRWVRYVYYQPEVFRYLEVVGLVGARPVGHEPRFAVTEQDLLEVKAVLGEDAGTPRVVLHPGASDTRRRWPATRFAEVGDALAAAGAEVLVTGTAPERDIVAEVVAAMRRPARPLVGELSMGGLAGLLSGSAVVVANDTGPLHLAAAVGAATVGIYWVGNLINGAPAYRRRHRPMLSWTINCPECGLDCTRDLYPARGGPQPCTHQPSFVADVPAAEACEAALDLLS
jgi:ADP-heptose:LPS heptosyltransferase